MTQQTVLIKANWLFWRKECSWIISITGKLRYTLDVVGLFAAFLHYLCSKWLLSSFYVIVALCYASCEHSWKLCVLDECSVLMWNKVHGFFWGCALWFLSRIIDNMPVTWCYDVEDGQKYCNPGFPIGCFVTPDGRVKDACVINVSGETFFG